MYTSLVLGMALSVSTSVDMTPKSFLGCNVPPPPQASWLAMPTCVASVKAPIIIEVNQFTDDAAQKFSTQMAGAQQTGQTIIPVIIDSYGGNVYNLLRMISIVQSSNVPVATIIEGKAMSSGAVLFMMGAEGHRFAGKQATILIHDASSFEEGKVEDMKVSAQEAERLNNLILSMASKNTGHSEDFLAKLLKDRGHTDWFISVDDAKKMNIVNKIGVPELKVKIKTEYTLE